MKTNEHRTELHLELEKIERVVDELQALAADVKGRAPSLREKLAAGALLSQFYMGVENVLKRISTYRGVSLPQSAHWHVELLERFAEPSHEALPALLDAQLLAMLDPYRQFRHVMRHGYGFDLDWTRMKEGAESIEPVFERFRGRVDGYLGHLPE